MSDVYIDMTLTIDLGKIAQRVVDAGRGGEFMRTMADLYDMHAREAGEAFSPHDEVWRQLARDLRHAADQYDHMLGALR